MKKMQQKIGKFIDARLWGGEDQVYDILLNMTEEIGEVWNIVKHLERDEKMLKKVIKESKAELRDGVGDLGYLVFKLAHILGIDVQEAMTKTLAEFEKRYPANKLRGHHGNLRAGGIDLKYQKK